VGNTTITGFVNATGSANVAGTLNVTGAATLANAITISGLATLNGNTNTTTANVSVILRVGANAFINATTIFVGNTVSNVTIGNTNIGGNANAQLNVVNTTSINATTLISVGTVYSNTTAVVVGSAVMNSSTVSTANVVATGVGSFGGTLAATGAITGSNTINITGAAVFGNTMSVTNSATFSNTVTVGGALTIETDYVVEVSTNTNIGSNSTSQVLYSFPKASYRAGKVMIVANNLVGATNYTQMSELVVAHDSTTAYVTTYATVASPFDAANSVSPLGTYSAQINNVSNNVELLMAQIRSNSSIKVVAHLIK
jgi:hypothetical protein